MRKYLIATLLCAFYGSAALAGDAKVNWGKLDDFTDIYPSYETKEMFRERVIKEFADVFTALARKLPDGMHLEINVSDLDLAGDVHGTMATLSGQIRVMRAIHWPKMDFTYQL
ncbi:MAG: DUF3016 domain-containing protein, partial [Undibacterium sp.]|nr:DUF3016 domain-containing protein [Undibacterium sp.]